MYGGGKGWKEGKERKKERDGREEGKGREGKKKKEEEKNRRIGGREMCKRASFGKRTMAKNRIGASRKSPNDLPIHRGQGHF